MNRTAKWILALLILLAAGSAAFLLLRPHDEGRIAQITIDGEVIREINLDDVRETEVFTVNGPAGFSNTIRVEPGRICVESAGCPDQICVHQGYIEDSTFPIVCLPNRLMIEILGGGDDLDTAAG